jgi:hypothetical protein
MSTPIKDLTAEKKWNQGVTNTPVPSRASGKDSRDYKTEYDDLKKSIEDLRPQLVDAGYNDADVIEEMRANFKAAENNYGIKPEEGVKTLQRVLANYHWDFANLRLTV